MKIACINTTHTGSTGKIMRQVAECARSCGHSAASYSTINVSVSRRPMRVNKLGDYPELEGHQYYGNYFSSVFHVVMGVLTGYNGYFSSLATRRLLREIEQFDPDILHLHNLHGYNINLPLLFRYIKRHNIPVIWTLHDCWAFTGRCPHFEMAHCDRWKTGCHDCPYPKHDYPASYVDCTKQMWELKKEWFTGVENMTIVTPSQWLADLVKQSFLKDYPVRVINNGIDLSVFQPTPSNFREEHGITPDKKLLLGVAFGWGKRKGLDVFCELAKRLDDSYQIVLVGTDDGADQQLPPNLISIHRTENQRELAKIYTAADVFVNPTREEVLGLVNVEALACGTPVITFDTGGSPECIDGTCGSVVPRDNVDALEREIKRVCEEKPYPPEACLQRAKAFDMKDRFEEYVKLYEKVGGII